MMSIKKYEDDEWCLDFIDHKVIFEIGDRILLNIGNRKESNWISIKIEEIKYNNDGSWISGDDGLSEYHLGNYSNQWIIDARN